MRPTADVLSLRAPRARVGVAPGLFARRLSLVMFGSCCLVFAACAQTASVPGDERAASARP